jgi:hypothetical protein
MLKMKTRQIALALILLLSINVSIAALSDYSNAAGTASISMVPSSSELTSSLIGQTLTVNLTIQNVQNLWQWATEITWDPQVLNYSSAQEGPFLSSAGQTLFPFVADEAARNGHIRDVSSTVMSTSSANGSGTLLMLNFKVIAAIQTTINFNVTYLLAPYNETLQENPSIPFTKSNLTLTASATEPTPTVTPSASPSTSPTATPSESPSTSPTATTVPSGTQSPEPSSTPTGTASPSGLSSEVLIIVGAGAVIAVVIGLGAFMQRRKS